MQNAGKTIALLNPDLTVIRLEVSASPMLDLVEFLGQLPEDGGLRIAYLDRGEADKLVNALISAERELRESSLGADRPINASPQEPQPRYLVSGRTWQIEDTRAGSLVGPTFYLEEDAKAAARRWNNHWWKHVAGA